MTKLRELATTALGHLNDYKVRYAIATTVVTVFGLAAAQTETIANGIGVAVHLITMFL